MAGKAKLPDPKKIKALVSKHKPPEFNACDKGLISCAGCAGWTLIDLSLIKVSDLVTEKGQLIASGYLPAEYNANGKSKLFIIGRNGFFRKVLQDVIDYRLENKHGILDRGLYAGLNPESRFFLQESGEPFGVTYREREGKSALVEPYDMRRKFNRFYLGEGVTWQTLNDSFVMNYWNDKSLEQPAQAIRDLIELTGQDPATLKKKTAREESSIQEILENLFK